MQINNNNQINFQAKFNHESGIYYTIAKAAKEKGIDLKSAERKVLGLVPGREVSIHSRYQKKFDMVLTTFSWNNTNGEKVNVLTETYKTDDIANSALDKFLEAVDSGSALHKKIFLA